LLERSGTGSKGCRAWNGFRNGCLASRKRIVATSWPRQRTRFVLTWVTVGGIPTWNSTNPSKSTQSAPPLRDTVGRPTCNTYWRWLRLDKPTKRRMRSVTNYHWTVDTPTNHLTRKLYYRKDDRAMRPIHRCPEKFRDS